jgi:transposase
MVRLQLDERQWKKLEAILASEQGAGRPGKNDRNFIEAVLWWRRTGVPWRDLPEEFGAWKTVFNRFDRWAKNGRWERVLEGLQTDRDNEWHSIDSTINRAHQHAAGGKGGAAEQGLGRSRGGLSTKVHLVVDALRLPITFEITEGQRHDIAQRTGWLEERSRAVCLPTRRTVQTADSVAEPLAVK